MRLRGWIDSVGADVRFALRYFARKPMTAATIVLVSALGIGVHAAVFSLIQAVTLRTAPGVPRDDALVAIRGKERLQGESRWRYRLFSYPELRQIAGRRDVFASVAGWASQHVALDTGDGDGRMAQVQFVTGGFFSTIGIRPILGPGLPPEDRPETAEPQLVAVLGHALWATKFASSPDVLGTSIRVNDVEVRIVGVAPPRFNGATRSAEARTLWMPLSARTAIRAATAEALASPDSALFAAVGRLRAGATLAQADARVRAIDAHFAAQRTPGAAMHHAADVVPLRGNLSVHESDETAIMTAVYEAIALLILLITCANVSALVVGAGVARRHEIATRLALGASRARLVRQLLTESSLLALAGGALGLLVYWWIASLLAVRLPSQDISPDLTTVALTLAVAAGTGILFGLSPALHATRQGAADALKDSSAGATARSRLQRVLVVAQIALTQPLLVGLGAAMLLLAGDGRRRWAVETAERTIAVALAPPHGASYRRGADEASLAAAVRAQGRRADAAMRLVAAQPGVVGLVRGSASYARTELAVLAEDRGPLPRASEPLGVRMAAPDPGFFDLLGIPIVRGRALAPTDSLEHEVPLVIGSDLAHDLWGTGDPIGRRLERTGEERYMPRRYTVVGVYDSRRGVASGGQPVVYAAMRGSMFNAYLIRTAGPALATISTVRSILRAEMPETAIMQLETLAERDEANRAEALRSSGAAGGGGVLALLLASIGLYGVVALALGQRRREIGIRIALGARPGRVVGMLFGGGLKLTMAGLLLGLPLSVAAMTVFAAEVRLPGVNVPLVGAAIALLVIAVASLATWIPARRAATVDPMIALRVE